MMDLSRTRQARAALSRAALFAVVWVILTGAAPPSWIIGVPTVVLATAISLWLTPSAPRRPSLLGLIYSFPWFLWESLRGGLDVATRVLRPRMRLDPGFQSYQMRLSGTQSRVLFADVVSLLPGTLSADLNENRLLVHAIDRGTDVEAELGRVEQRLAAVVGEKR